MTTLTHIFGLPVPLAVLIAVGMIAMAGYISTRNRALALAGGDARTLHSLPRDYGTMAAMFGAVPALGVMVIWLSVQPMLVQNAALPLIPADQIDSAGTQSLILSDVSRVAQGLDVQHHHAGCQQFPQEPEAGCIGHGSKWSEGNERQPLTLAPNIE